MASRFHLTFFCELDPAPLTKLFDHSSIIETLWRLDASVSLGLMDFSDERARIVRLLNACGIPVTAWLLLPKESGYWFNQANVDQAALRTKALFDWTMMHNLRWAAVGLDIEPDIHALEILAQSKREGIARLRQNLASRERYLHSLAGYQEIILSIHARGLPVESYQFPFIVDERKSGSTLLQRLSGVVDLQVDREVLMLYSSFYQKLGAALLKSYAAAAGGIGLGSTGGGVTMEGLVSAVPLTWQAFSRDLRLAAKVNPNLYIFSLEGCHEQGFLDRLLDFDWDAPMDEPVSPDRLWQVGALRVLLRAALRVSRLFLR